MPVQFPVVSREVATADTMAFKVSSFDGRLGLCRCAKTDPEIDLTASVNIRRTFGPLAIGPARSKQRNRDIQRPKPVDDSRPIDSIRTDETELIFKRCGS